MKYHSIRHRSLGLACCASVLSLTLAPGVAAQNTRGGDASRSSSAGVSQSRSAGADVEAVRVTRASTYLGSDVIASDGRKVGDIVDYYFDLGGTPQLAYVLIMTGGFLNMGGDTRAVPASALTATGDNVRMNVNSADYWQVPVLPENRERFLSEPSNAQRISQIFNRSNRTASSGAGQSSDENVAGTTSTTASSGATAAAGTSTADDPNRAGAMTGRASGQGTQRLVSFSELQNTGAYGADDQRLGFFDDAWISLNENRVPYVEITPTFHPFRRSFDRRYAIPTARLEQEREFAGYDVKVTAEDLMEAEPVTEAEGVRMLEEGEIGTTVLRVTVPQR